MAKRGIPVTKAPHTSARSAPSTRRYSVLFFAVFLVSSIGLAIAFDWWSTIPANAPGQFVGRKSCVECHPKQGESFHDSHHDLAMDLATSQTVLGDFSGVNFSHHGIESRMFRDGDRYMIHTEGPDGKLADFEIKYVFGVTPLQQYMVEFDRPPDAKPGECGRLQVLRISWDTNRKAWFYLPPPDVADRILPGDDLHWTGIAQRWNTMCADCHSTNFRKRFDTKEVRYKSQFSEIDVSCEACHGAGSQHVELAKAYSLFWDRKQGKAIGGFSKADPERELDTCLRCHSRRQLLTEDWRAGQSLTDIALIESLSPMTYHCDGQIKDEVYEHGAFLQSRMHAKGVRCSDCHDPHSVKLKHTGNQVCTSCHQHPAGKYDTPAHHHHLPGGAGAQCVDCHMPSKTYMEIDVRRDHSFRVPRPDQSAKLGTPNACTGCHVNAERLVGESMLSKIVDSVGASHLHAKPTDYHKLLELRSKSTEIDKELRRLDEWAISQVEAWYGAKRERGAEYATSFDAQWNRRGDAQSALESVIAKRSLPAIVRASALSQLGQTGAPPIKEIIAALKDASPLVRAAACSAAQIHFPGVIDFLESNLPRREWVGPRFTSPIRPLVSAVAACLGDPELSVRVEAARALAKLPIPLRQEFLTTEQQPLWDVAIEDWKRAMQVSNDRGGSHTALGVFFESQEEWSQAKLAYEAAIRVEPSVVGPRSNLSILLERVADDLALPSANRRFQLDNPTEQTALRDAALNHLQIESSLLKRDAELAPQLAPLHYQHALALVRLRDYREAGAALKRAAAIEPENTTYLYTLAILLHQHGETPEQRKEALAVAAQLVKLAPGDPRFSQLQAEITSGPPEK